MPAYQLEKEVRKIYAQIIQGETSAKKLAAQAHEAYRLSAKNLYRYLILRSFDLRKIHDGLSDLGLSSLRTSEGYVYSNVSSVLKLLNQIQGKEWSPKRGIETIGYKKSKKLLRKHSEDLFGQNEPKNIPKIMVTLPDEAAENFDLIKKLVQEGMSIARINLSHGNEEMWSKMVENLQKAQVETRIPVKIYMDLAGPKIRTSTINIYTKKGKIKDFIKLKEGDSLILTKRETLGKHAVYDDAQTLIQPAEVGVLLPQIIDDLQPNDVVFFDDGMIKATVLSKNENDAELVITKAYKTKLAANKGINLPSTRLNLPSLTERDTELLPFICQYADIVGYSFVRTPQDVQKLYQELEKNQDKNIGVVLKIENQEAFENLPLILFEAMKRQRIGVMIARGDLAVEIGFERISEVQSQILWLCEAAHVPVIWATQVLENLAKTGIATRAEITDAAKSVQAECVMLNKGAFIVDAVRTLSNILLKMGAHSSKKKSALRALKVANHALQLLEKQQQK